MKFKYPINEISSYANTEMEVTEQATKAARMAACQNNTIYRNKNKQKEVNSRIYKAAIPPIMTYTYSGNTTRNNKN